MVIMPALLFDAALHILPLESRFLCTQDEFSLPVSELLEICTIVADDLSPLS
jgi:hypothetical protein